MRIPDVNVLVYSRSPISPHYGSSRDWMERALSGTDPVAFPVAVSIGFVRIVTNPRLSDPPLSSADAFDQLDEWQAQAPSIEIHPGPRHLMICRELLHATGTAGNLTTDAHLAALAIEHHATVASYDSDFHRFPRIRFEFLR